MLRSQRVGGRPMKNVGRVTGQHSMGNMGNGVQTNLRTRGGQFRNRRTGQPVPANQPYHTHNGQAMAGARHSSRPHDKYDGVGGGMMRGTIPPRTKPNVQIVPVIPGSGGNVPNSWTISCGGGIEDFSVSCDEGNNAGFSNGGTVSYGSVSCSTTTDTCNQPA